jgi:hypothetical protein
VVLEVSEEALWKARGVELDVPVRRDQASKTWIEWTPLLGDFCGLTTPLRRCFNGVYVPLSKMRCSELSLVIEAANVGASRSLNVGFMSRFQLH